VANSLSEKKPETPPAAAPVEQPRTFTEADVRAAQAETAARFLADQNRMLQDQALRRTMPNAQPGPDPLARFAQEGVTMTPDDQLKSLDGGIRNRIRQEMSPVLDRMKAEQDNERIQMENKMALQAIMSGNPDVAADHEGFAGAISRAQFRAGQRGLQLDSTGIAQLALSIYREEHRVQTPDPPVLEGGSSPVAGAPPGSAIPRQGERKLSLYEEFYNGKKYVDATQELHEESLNEKDQIDSYLDMKNGFLEDHGVNVDITKVVDIQGQNEARRGRRQASGG